MYTSPNFIRLERVGENINAGKLLQRNWEERDLLEDLDVDGRIMLMNLVDIVREGLDLIHVAQDREMWQTFVDTSVIIRDL
jgi:hypothetical protein